MRSSDFRRGIDGASCFRCPMSSSWHGPAWRSTTPSRRRLPAIGRAGSRMIRTPSQRSTPAISMCSRSRRTRFPLRRSAARWSTETPLRSRVCSRPRFWPILNAIDSIAHDRMRLNKLQKTAVTALEDIKARDIAVFDVRKLTSLYDTLIIASAESARQVKALATHVRDRMKAAGATIIGVEGEASGEWVLVDCGDVVVHVMQPAVRAYYNLEELWAPPAPKRRAPAKSAAAAAAA